MPEQETHTSAAKFISSLVKSLQILCNGQVDFSESIELVGHINVRVDHKFKFDYIVDEQVSKEGEDSTTTFLSNSYHSCPPVKQQSKKSSQTELDQNLMFSEIPQRRTKELKSVSETSAPTQDYGVEDNSVGGEDNSQNYSVNVQSPSRQGNQTNQMVVKLEGGDDSNDCMVLPASPGDYEPGAETYPIAGTSRSFEGSKSDHNSRARKRRKVSEQGAEDSNESKGEVEGSGKSTGGKRSASELIGKFAAYECSYCSVILTEYEDLSLHSKNCPSPSCNMICLTCGEKFPSKPEMRQHLKFVHNHKTFGCRFCDMMFLSSSGLLSHTKAKHKPDPKTLCQICGQAFHNRANLEGHMNMHLGLKPFKCSRCGKSYGHSKSLITHEKNCSRSNTSRKNSRQTAPQPKSDPNRTVPANVSMPTVHQRREEGGGGPSGDERSTEEVEVSDSDQSYSFNESYQSYDGGKKLCNNEPNLQAMQNAEQPFSYNASYQPLQSMDMSGINNANSAAGTLGGNVYAQPNTDFVLPPVAYGMYPHGMLPDHS